MLLRGSNTRGARGAANRSRGSRGRGSPSRGAANSSSKFRQKIFLSLLPAGQRVLQENPNTYNSRDANQQSKYKTKNNYSSTRNTGTSSSNSSPNTFEQERLENAAKREQRGQSSTGTMVNGRGARGSSRGGLHSNKQVRFTDPPAEQKVDPFNKAPSPAPTNPFGGNTNTNASQFPSPANNAFNPFAPKQDTTSNPFSTQSSNNAFGAPSQSKPPTNIFGKPSGNQTETAAPTPFGAPSQTVTATSGVLGSSSASPAANTFSQPSASVFGAPAGPKSSAPSTSSFNKPSTTAFGSGLNPSSPFSGAVPKTNGFTSATPTTNNSFAQSFGAHSNGKSPSLPQTSLVQSTSFGFPSASSNATPFKPTMNGTSAGRSSQSGFSIQPAPQTNGTASSTAAAKIEQLLRKERIVAPLWPKLPPNHQNFKSEIEKYWRASKEYRNKVRASLIRAGLFDDPDIPKNLSDAIDFNGICEDMCPDFEKANRIFERNVMGAETEIGPDGQSYPAPHKMIKAFARSAAGQDAPLPMDVRSPAALTRTLDYLFKAVLGDDEDNLPKVHHFLWDRTREIRRDFVFQQSSMNASELPHQIYCLEYITRFHVIALHQMSKEGVTPAEEFSEQQEVEQLGKTLLSLIQTYDDCKVQGVESENEAEFRSYYALLNSRSPGILQTVQDWGWKYWGESDQIRTAVTLIEALQNTWDSRGPLKPQAAMDVAQNAFSRFFAIVADKNVSYTMACFAEIHFNSVRKSILKTILSSYRKQRDQTKDWTLSKLNQFLRFDDEGDIISFGEAYGLNFDEVDGEECLSFESEGVLDPFPPLKQRHSYSLVERKRGHHSLLDVIYTTVYDEAEEQDNKNGTGNAMNDEDSLFVKDNLANHEPDKSFQSDINGVASSNQESDKVAAEENDTKPTSLFDRISQPKTIANYFFNTKPAEQPPSTQPSLFFPKAAETGATSITKQPESPFSFAKKLDSTTTFSKPEAISTAPKQPDLPSLFSKQSEVPSIFSKQPVKQHPFSFTQPTPAPSTPPVFKFDKPASVTPADDNSQEALSLGKYTVSTTPSESPKTPFSLGQHSVSALPTAPAPSNTLMFPTSQSPPPQSTLFSKPTVPASIPAPALLAQNAPPQSEAPKYSNDIVQELAGNGQISSSFRTDPPRKLDRQAKLDGLTNWVVLGQDGLLDHFTELTVQNLLQDTVRNFEKELYKKAAKEAEELARKQADEHRQKFLSTKYFNKWREGVRHLWQIRMGRENRRAMREMAESMRASKAAQSATIVDDFRATTTGSRRGSLESLLGATGILNGVHDSNKQIRAIVQNDGIAVPRQSHISNRSMKKPSTTKSHQRGKSDDPLRRSLMSDSSYLNGGSRIHLMSSYNAIDDTRRQVSGVQTDYFRLKARGISTLPNGTPMASSVAKDYLRQKRSFDGIEKSSTPKRSSFSSIPRSVPSKSLISPRHRQTTLEREESIRDLKEKAKAVVSEDHRTRRKRSFDSDNDDDALFERAKRVREQMDEGTQWYRKELERHSRSVS